MSWKIMLSRSPVFDANAVGFTSKYEQFILNVYYK